MHCAHLGLGMLVAGSIEIVAPYFALDRETRSLDAPTRETLGGTYVRLPDGVTHYELSGPATGAIVVLIHGGTIPLYAWDVQVPALHEAGLRVLRYDQFGRGYSDRPPVDYDRAFYLKQLEDLLTALDIEGRVNLVGVSFGGALAATYTAAHPERVAKLVLIAPIVDYAEGKALFGLAKIPLVSDWYARVFSVRATVKRASGFFEESEAGPSYPQRFDEQTRFEGYERSLLSMSRTDALMSYRSTYAKLGDQPKLLLWGSEDSEIPRDHMVFLQTTLEKLTWAQLSGAGHGVAIERRDKVNQQITTFLTSTPISEN